MSGQLENYSKDDKTGDTGLFRSEKTKREKFVLEKMKDKNAFRERRQQQQQQQHWDDYIYTPLSPTPPPPTPNTDTQFWSVQSRSARSYTYVCSADGEEAVYGHHSQ